MKNIKNFLIGIIILCCISCGHKLSPEAAEESIYLSETDRLEYVIQQMPSNVKDIKIDSVKVIFPEVPMKAYMYTTWTIERLNIFNPGFRTEKKSVIIMVRDIQPMKEHPEYIEWYTEWDNGYRSAIL